MELLDGEIRIRDIKCCEYKRLTTAFGCYGVCDRDNEELFRV
ncbi:hypothetical protein [Candidatus Hodgkinia cicadicola]